MGTATEEFVAVGDRLLKQEHVVSRKRCGDGFYGRRIPLPLVLCVNVQTGRDSRSIQCGSS